MKNQVAKSLVKVLALALGMACMQSASAQHFKHLSVTGGAPLVQIASGRASRISWKPGLQRRVP